MELVTASRVPFSRPSTTLSTLPHHLPEGAVSQPPWSILSTTSLVEALEVDRGLWNGWRCRGLTPSPLPTAWFRQAAGNALYYRRDHIDGWLADRRDEPFEFVEHWGAWLDQKAGIDFPTRNQVRAFVRRWAEGEGPVQGDVRFTAAGWRAYLDSLTLSLC